ncbi:Putative mariner transposase [Caligus rogercresseyi]|uniref:Mariner transposase n=1 Tax=Caligus rogercresseyi TaxID=217165 RepID=A0A7T8GLM5_CALRO|nr:Putative mariner transposase [Caligus rogercresseyi]
MEKSEFRVLIKHSFLREKTIAETKAKLDKYYGDSAPSISMVKKWFTEFRCGRTSTIDAERSGRPVEVATPETIQKIHDMVLADRRLKVREIVEAIGISHGSVVSILKDHLAMKKLSARWVPRLLTIDHKRNRVTTSMECLALFNRNKDEFFRRFVTVDETWIHYNTPETKQQSKQWVLKGESAPKKANVGLSANKVMATVFWNARGVIHIDYLQKGRTMNGEYYTSLLDRFNDDLKKKRPHLAKKKVLFHQDNARVNTCVVSMAKFYELRFELLPHPPDYFLFPNLKKWLAGKRFYSNNEIISQTNTYFEDLEKSYFLEGIKKLEKRWTKCIELKGDYFFYFATTACSRFFSAKRPHMNSMAEISHKKPKSNIHLLIIHPLIGSGTS